MKMKMKKRTRTYVEFLVIIRNVLQTVSQLAPCIGLILIYFVSFYINQFDHLHEHEVEMFGIKYNVICCHLINQVEFEKKIKSHVNKCNS